MSDEIHLDLEAKTCLEARESKLWSGFRGERLLVKSYEGFWSKNKRMNYGNDIVYTTLSISPPPFSRAVSRIKSLLGRNMNESTGGMYRWTIGPVSPSGRSNGTFLNDEWRIFIEHQFEDRLRKKVFTKSSNFPLFVLTTMRVSPQIPQTPNFFSALPSFRFTPCVGHHFVSL